jgi:hypothetical protein
MKATGRNCAIALAALFLLATAATVDGQNTEAALQSLLGQPVQSADATTISNGAHCRIVSISRMGSVLRCPVLFRVEVKMP